jgi:DNA-binding transcriptional LysR family regulator
MSPSGISHQLSLLERAAGAPLLERVGRGVRLTDAGRRLAERGSDILAALELAESEVRANGSAPAGTCRVAAFGSAARALVPTLLECQRRHPGLRVELVQSEPEVSYPGLLSGEFDVVVSEEYPGTEQALPRHVVREVLATDPLQVVVTSGLLADRDLPSAGGTIPWALEPVGASSRTWAMQHCLGQGFSPSVQFESWDLDLLLLLVLQGAAASVLPQLALESNAPGSDLVTMGTGTSRTLVSLSRRARKDDPSVQAVRSALHARFRASAE